MARANKDAGNATQGLSRTRSPPESYVSKISCSGQLCLDRSLLQERRYCRCVVTGYA